MKGKLKRAFALGFVSSSVLVLTACATAPQPRQELSILDAVANGSLSQPQSCAAMDAATVCVQSMRLNRVKDCGCVDRRQLSNSNLRGGF